MTYHTAKGRAHLGHLLALLQVRPRTCVELADEMRLTKAAVLRMLRYLRAEPKRVYIHDWLDGDDGHIGPFCPQYALGSAADKRKPPKKTKLEISRDRMRRIHSDPELHLREIYRQRVRHRIARATRKKSPATWLDALMA